MRIRILIFVALFHLGAMSTRAQTSFFTDKALQQVTVTGTPTPLTAAIPYAFVRVCGLPLTQASPCLPLAAITDVNGVAISNSIGSNFGQLTTDATGRFTIGCTLGASLQVQVQQSASNTPALNYPVTCPGVGNNPQFAALSVTGQITSSLSTGTAPFSIASTTVVPNLNAALVGGQTPPASAIVGVNDTQTLVNKTISRLVLGTTAGSCAVTGAGTGATCTLAASSNDTSGALQINTGTTPGTSGTWTLTFSSSFTNAAFCSVSLGSANTTLNARATVFDSSNGAASSQSGAWDNNGVAPTGSQATSFLINYVCGGH